MGLEYSCSSKLCLGTKIGFERSNFPLFTFSWFAFLSCSIITKVLATSFAESWHPTNWLSLLLFHLIGDWQVVDCFVYVCFRYALLSIGKVTGPGLPFPNPSYIVQGRWVCLKYRGRACLLCCCSPSLLPLHYLAFVIRQATSGAVAVVTISLTDANQNAVLVWPWYLPFFGAMVADLFYSIIFHQGICFGHIIRLVWVGEFRPLAAYRHTRAHKVLIHTSLSPLRLGRYHRY